MVEVFIFGEDQKTGSSRVVAAYQVHAACQLADTAARAFVKVSVNKGFDGFLPIKLSILKKKNITYYVLCKLHFYFFIALEKKLWYRYG